MISPMRFAVLALGLVSATVAEGQAGRTKGQSDAPITIYELSDFQCPFCRQFAMQTLPELQSEYIETGKVKLIFWNFPLTSLHPNAVAAHEVAMCAEMQGDFWPMHDLLYRHQEVWGPLTEPGPTLLAYADSIGADRGALLNCVESGAMISIIEREAVEANRRLGATSTPTFLIDGRLILPGAAEIGVWREILDSIISVKANGQ